MWIITGVSAILCTDWTMDVFRNIFFIQKVSILAIVPVMFGIIFIGGAFFTSKIFWISLILSLIALLKGLYFILGPINQSGYPVSSTSHNILYTPMEERRHPVCSVDYPGTLQEFDEWFTLKRPTLLIFRSLDGLNNVHRCRVSKE